MIKKIIEGAASNVACESREEVSSETLALIEDHLLGKTIHSDKSLINSLYELVLEKNDEEIKGKSRGRR